MRRQALLSIIAALVVYSGFMTWLDYQQDQMNDKLLTIAMNQCLKPAAGPRTEASFEEHGTL